MRLNDPNQDYINACFMNSPFPQPDGKGDKKIIASQGPLPHTTHDFWKMIVEQNVTMIVSTCKPRENGRDKCNIFYPSEA